MKKNLTPPVCLLPPVCLIDTIEYVHQHMAGTENGVWTKKDNTNQPKNPSESW